MTLSYTLDRPSRVELRIYDLRGRIVTTLVSESPSAGAYTRVWEGRDASGQSVASGVYFAELRAEGRRQSRRMVLVR